MVAKLFERFFIALGAIACLQFPLFMVYYEEQLIGHVAELKWQVSQMEEAASKSKKSLEHYFQKFITNPDQDFSEQGRLMKKTYSRWVTLSNALRRLQEATSFTRPWVFLFNADWKIVKETAASFHPGFNFNFEALIYTFVGIFIGYGCYKMLFLLLGRRFRQTGQ